MTSGSTGHWTKMHQSLVKFSESEASNHMPSLADFTTTMAELKFSVHTAHHPHALCRLLPKGDAVVEEVDLSLRDRSRIGHHFRHEVDEVESERRGVSHADPSGVDLGSRRSAA